MQTISTIGFDIAKSVFQVHGGPLVAHAQQKTDDLPTIGIIQSFPNENFEALTEGLREAGYIDGQNVLMEKRVRSAAGRRRWRCRALR
jgi:hypothetical protein